jgi:hypothetical protein
LAYILGGLEFMKIRRALLIIPLLALLPAPFLGLAPFLWPVLDRALTVYASPEMQTPFLQAYNPQQVLDRFRTVENTFSQGPSIGFSAGYGFARCERVFDEPLIIQSAGYPALIHALNKDLTSVIIATGTSMVSETIDDLNGTVLQYQAGKSAGTVTIAPVELIASPQRYWQQPLRPGEIAVRVRVRIEEKWFEAGVPSEHSTASLLPPLARSPW